MSAVTEMELEFFKKMRTCREVDVFFRQRFGTAHKAADAGILPCIQRRRGGNVTYLIDPRDAYGLWGPK